MADCDSPAGGLIGNANFSTNTTIDQVVVKAKPVEGKRSLGGMIGSSTNVNISNSIVTGAVFSNENTTGGTNTVKMGGLIGVANGGSLTSNIVIISKKANRSGSDSSEGRIYGASTTNPICLGTLPGRNFALGSDAVSGPCNGISNVSPATDITTLATYTAGSFATDYPNWVWNPNDMGTGGDIPRLAWEIANEVNVPYLKRECSGLFSTPSGDGSSATNPKTICSALQLNAMSPNLFYILKKDLFLSGITFPTKASGVYHLDGDGHTLFDFNISAGASLSGNFGIFQELLVGSEIKNLNIGFVNASATALVATGAEINVGLLAGKNSGTIKNVNIDNSLMNFESIDFISGTVGQVATFGGLAGFNNGTILNSNVGTTVNLIRPKIDSTDSLMIGGVVGNNFGGTINVVQANGDVGRSLGGTEVSSVSISFPFPGFCSAYSLSANQYLLSSNGSDLNPYFCNSLGNVERVYKTSANEYIGSIAGKNSGNISEVQIEGSLFLKDLTSNSTGTIAPIVADNSGSLQDIYYRGSFNSSFSTLSKAVYNSSGSLSRIIFKPNSLSGFDTSVGNVFSGGSNNYTDTVCASSSGGANCFYSSNFMITPSFPGFTFEDGTHTAYMTTSNWNYGLGFLPDLTKTWMVDGSDIKLIKTDGGFDKLGTGF
jgi:hypothetical protein